VVASGANVGVSASGTTGVDAAGMTAVHATGQGATGVAVLAEAVSNTAAAVTAFNDGGGAGVKGSSSAGRGGVFSGAAAQVRLVPGVRLDSPEGRQAG